MAKPKLKPKKASVAKNKKPGKVSLKVISKTVKKKSGKKA